MMEYSCCASLAPVLITTPLLPPHLLMNTSTPTLRSTKHAVSSDTSRCFHHSPNLLQTITVKTMETAKNTPTTKTSGSALSNDTWPHSDQSEWQLEALLKDETQVEITNMDSRRNTTAGTNRKLHSRWRLLTKSPPSSKLSGDGCPNRGLFRRKPR
jgi:hypothetical protein